ncbi:helix-turn-helix DNA binding domain protein [Gordonia phage RedWattleHog]|uniref:Helix-turn-helix DNA binding domain protein n=1 Tax=Gordonia phage Stormageddon TaxID=2656541 RepID=A0A649VRQ7_9CAUD|nr:helix-turn-helix DNA binding domain protein [Gordonia phage Stormageddon]QGJ94988.1 helix-turn-helix DNA binding domain protein [Gordonia phage Stormageddon]QLF83633.1 helix-turn-helix DNA binding domain protein [Gordonia phage RedWattleHog]
MTTTTEPKKPPRFATGALVAHNLRRLRTETGMSQKDFSDLCHASGLAWSPARMSNAETNAVPVNAIHELVALRDLLSKLLDRHVSLDEFFEPVPDGEPDLA